MQSPESFVHVNSAKEVESNSVREDDQGVFPQTGRIEELEGNGITSSDINKLKAANFYTILAVANATLRQLSTVKGISENKAQKIQEAAYQLVDMGFTTAEAFFVQQEQLITITTGSKSLDTLLHGGIETGALTELYGEFRTGKSQLCHQLAVTCQLPIDMGGGEGRCLFIDCEGTFRAERVFSIAERYGLDPHEAMRNIAVARSKNNEHLLKLLDSAQQMMAQTRFVIVIIDSIMAQLRVDFQGRGELSERQMRLSAILKKLRGLADEFGVAIVYTNQVVAQVDGMSFAPDPKKPIGGNILAHASTTRLQFKKARGELRTCRVCDSPCLPESDCQFGIYENGIDDPREKEPVERDDDN